MSDTQVFAPDLFAGKKVLITGGGTGIGFTIAHEFGALGAEVIIAARDVERLEKAVAELEAEGIKALAHYVNIRKEDDVAALFDWLKSTHGLPNILVNNAGGQFAAPALDLSPNGFRAVVDLNLSGTWLMSQAYARHLVEADRGGKIINIVIVFQNGTPGMVHGGAARAGVVSLTKGLAVAWSRYGITVNAIAPGEIDTPGHAQYDRKALNAGVEGYISGAKLVKNAPVPRLGTAREVALSVAFLASPAGDYFTGAVLTMDGGERLMTVPVA